MNDQSNSPQRNNRTKPVIVYGVDKDNKPNAGYFKSDDATLAVKAAAALKLKAVEITNEELADVASKIKPGRVAGPGKAFVPPISRPIYDKLISAIGSKPATTKPSSKSSEGGRDGLPKDWSQIKTGNLVIAHWSAKEGWWEAIVISIDADMLTLRWRDYAKYPQVIRHRLSVALAHPGEPEKAA